MALSSCFAARRSSRKAERAFGLQLLWQHVVECDPSPLQAIIQAIYTLERCSFFWGSATRVSVSVSATKPAAVIFSSCVADEGRRLLSLWRAVMKAILPVLMRPIQTWRRTMLSYFQIPASYFVQPRIVHSCLWTGVAEKAHTAMLSGGQVLGRQTHGKTKRLHVVSWNVPRPASRHRCTSSCSGR